MNIRILFAFHVLLAFYIFLPCCIASGFLQRDLRIRVGGSNNQIIIRYSCSMNQGLYFGQMVIGPAGSGKVDSPPPSPPTVKSCKRWPKLSKGI